MSGLTRFMLSCGGAFLVLMLSAGFSTAQQDTSRLARELAKVPSKEAARTNPLAGDPRAMRAGEKLFHRYCQECHGDASQETRPRGPNLHTEAIQSAPAGAIAWYLKNGNLGAGMPAWSRLPEPQRWQIVAYLKSPAQ